MYLLYWSTHKAERFSLHFSHTLYRLYLPPPLHTKAESIELTVHQCKKMFLLSVCQLSERLGVENPPKLQHFKKLSQRVKLALCIWSSPLLPWLMSGDNGIFSRNQVDGSTREGSSTKNPQQKKTGKVADSGAANTTAFTSAKWRTWAEGCGWWSDNGEKQVYTSTHGTSRTKRSTGPSASHANCKMSNISGVSTLRSYRWLSSDGVLPVNHDLSLAIGALQVDGIPHVHLDFLFTPKRSEKFHVVEGHSDTFIARNTTPDISTQKWQWPLMTSRLLIWF